MRQMFCSVLHDTSSSQTQVILMPPAHFSIFSLHCGTMAMVRMPGAMEGIPDMGIDELACQTSTGDDPPSSWTLQYSFRLRAAGQTAGAIVARSLRSAGNSHAVLWTLQSDNATSVECGLPFRRVGVSCQFLAANL